MSKTSIDDESTAKRILVAPVVLRPPPATFMPKVSLMRLNKGLEAGVLLVQGVLAGLTLASLYTMALADSLESFVAAYEVRTRLLARLLVVLV